MAAMDDASFDDFLGALDNAFDAYDERAEARKVLAIAAFATTYIAANDDVADEFVGWLKRMGAPDALTSDVDLVKYELASAALTLTLTD